MAVLAVLLGAVPSAARQVAQDAAAPEEAAAGPRVEVSVVIETTDGRANPLGTFVIELNTKAAPRHSANFLKLARQGYYDGTTFHRIVPGFIVQGGDPLSRTDWRSPRLGTGGPKYTLEPEFGLPHLRGAVAAARQGDAVNPKRVSNGSQFFICLADLPSLDAGKYSVFGRVVSGMDVVDKIARVKNAGSRAGNRALERVVMKQVKVEE